MQEQMSSVNDSGDFQDVESNCSGRLSYVPSQPVMIQSSRALLSRDKRLPLDTLTTSSTTPVELPQNYMVGQQRQQISELQFVKFPDPQSFQCGKFDSKPIVTTCSDFPSDAMLWIKKVEMVDSVDELKSSRSVCGKDFPNFEMLDAKIASALNKIIQNSQFKKKVSLEEQKA